MANARSAFKRHTTHRLALERLEDRSLLAAISIAPATVREGNVGDQLLNFVVSLDDAADHPVSVDFRTQGLSAASGPDYRGTTGTLVIPAGQKQASLLVQVHSDTTEESIETLAVILSNQSAGDSIAVPQAIGIILDDDRPLPPPPSASAALNVLNFGAVGDGVTNNDVAFTAALAAAKAQGKALYVPAGTYAHANLIQNDSVDLFGAGIDTVLLATNPLQSSIYLSGTGAKLRDVLVTVQLGNTQRQSTPQSTAVSVRPNASNFVVQNVIIDKAGSAGVFIEGAHDGLVDGVAVVNTLADGIHITGGAFNITVQNCFIRNTGDDCIAVVSYENHGPVQPISHDVLIQNNDVGFNPWGRGIAVTGGNNVQILNNLVTATHSTGIYIACESFWQTYGMDSIVVRGNTVTASPALPNPNNQPGIEVANQRPGFVVRRITIDQNFVDQTGSGYTGIRIGPDVQWIGVTGNQITTTGKAIDVLPGVTIDTAAPTSQVLALPAQTSSTSFTVRWQGADDAAGSGVSRYNIWVSLDGGVYTLWRSNVTTTSAVYGAIAGQHTYAFKAQAIDNSGNLEALPATADASTTVVPLVIGTVTAPITLANVGSLSASGTAAAGSTIRVVLANLNRSIPPKFTVADSSGAWSISGINAISLFGGLVSYNVISTDSQGNATMATKTPSQGMRPTLQAGGLTFQTSQTGAWGPFF